MTLRRSADGRVTRHVGDGFSSERAQSDGAAKLRGHPRRFDAGVPGADHYYIQIRHEDLGIDDYFRFMIEWIADQLSIAGWLISNQPIVNRR